MGKTAVEKIISAHVGHDAKAGDFVVADVDLAMTHDTTGPIAITAFREYGREKVWDASKVVIMLDHAAPSPNERISNLPTPDAALGAVAVLAAQPPDRWEDGVQALGGRLGLPAGFLRGTLKDHVRAWNTNARRAADSQLARLHDVKQRLTPAEETHETPADRPQAATPTIERIPTRPGHDPRGRGR